ncbi:MAG: hypothetical protein V1689_15495 [Pseudomonadota bacterium]
MGKDDLPIVKRLGPSCPGRLEIPTEKEREALAAMRSLKERIRKLKGCLAELEGSHRNEDTGDARDIREELARLREDWDRWEKKRQQAATERMILLGHEEEA